MSLNGPSNHAVKVIRSLLSRPKNIYAIVADTGLSERTVRAQIDALRKSDAVSSVKKSNYRGGGRIGNSGPIAIYKAVVLEVR